MGSIYRNCLILMVAAVVLAACSSAPPQRYSYSPDAVAYQGNEQGRLRQHYRAWAGAPYQMGGMSRGGIDCSGFVYVTFRDVYGMHLPRSTDQLVDVGEEVDLDQVQTGDLLIFKTGFKQRHVGIYLGNGEFIHASTSSGVMSSNVYSPYWRDAYRQTRRVALP